VEASALHAPSVSRIPLGAPLLRLRSDEQLLVLFRAGSEEAFNTIHDRYRQRLFAYVRQMLSSGSRQDAEDVMQDVFVRAYGALRADAREINLRAWLYRVAHNRCIDHLRRPTPPPAEIFEMSRKPLHDPIEEAQRREDLTRLVEDVGRLPEQQRSALLMREIDGMSYADLAAALDVTVPAVKSLLVRARVGLVEAAEARDADCCEIRDDLLATYDRGVKASGRARRHMRSCAGCRDYRQALRGMRRSFAALTPVSAGMFGSIAASLGLGGGGAAAGGAAAGGSGAAVSAAAGGTLATATACKVAAVVCTAALTAAGGAVEVHKLKQRSTAPEAAVSAASIAPVRLAPVSPAPLAAQPALRRTHSTASYAPAVKTDLREKQAAERTNGEQIATTAPLVADVPATDTTPVSTVPDTSQTSTGAAGGVAAPDTGDTSSGSTPGSGTQTGTSTPTSGTTAPPSGSGGSPSDTGSGSTGTAAPPSGSSGGSDSGTPPSEH
jgi:RNA polymerase sigma factor (sigma-70 family)